MMMISMYLSSNHLHSLSSLSLSISLSSLSLGIYIYIYIMLESNQVTIDDIIDIITNVREIYQNIMKKDAITCKPNGKVRFCFSIKKNLLYFSYQKNHFQVCFSENSFT